MFNVEPQRDGGVNQVQPGGAAGSGAGNPSGAAQDELPVIPGMDGYIDLADGLARIMGRRKVYKTLLQSFLKEPRIDRLKQEIQNGDLAAAKNTVHAVKGVSGNLSLTAVRDASNVLDRQLKDGYYTEEALKTYIDSLEKTIELINELINHL